jgi:hypothetical protein
MGVERSSCFTPFTGAKPASVGRGASDDGDDDDNDNDDDE